MKTLLQSLLLLSVVTLIFVIISFVVRNKTGERENSIERGESDALHSFEWWYAQRSLPNDTIPRDGLQKAFRYVQSSMRKDRKFSPSSVTSAGQWKSLGPNNIGGRTLAIAVDPVNPNIVWAGAASGGLWKTTNGGTGLNSWSYINTGFNTISVSSVVIDQSNHNVMYIGTGEISLYQRPLVGTVGARASYGMGILKSTDGGSSWTQTGLTFTFPQITAVERIVLNPKNTHTIYTATSEGVYKSTDGGASWSVSNSVLMAMDVAINPIDTTILYSAHGNSNSSLSPGIYQSTDAGNSWTQLTNGLPSSNFGRTALAISPINPSVIYAGITDASIYQTIGLYRTTDGGATWAVVSTQDYVGTQGWYNNVVVIDPRSTDTVFCSGYSIYKSTNGGSNLTSVSPSDVHVDHHAIAFDLTNPNVMYFGTDGGIWKSTDGGSTYIDVNNSYVTTQFYPGLAVYPLDSVTTLGGLQDNGTLAYYGNPNWGQVYYNDGGWCAIDPTNKNNMYAESQYGDIEKSTNGGLTFGSITNGLPSSSSDWNFLSPFVIAPSNPNILYAGSSNVYKTTTGGSVWFSSNGNSTLNGTNISCIGVSWTSSDTVIAGTGNGALGVTPTFAIFRSTNGGGFWTNVNAGLPNRYPTDIEFDPTNSAIAYLTYSGYGTPHVFKSLNAGATWINITSNLPDIPHQSVTVDPANPQHVYVGTDLGVFHSSNGGGTWEEFNEGMPPAMVLDLTVSRSNGMLRAATFGNGIYERPLVRIPVLTLTSFTGGNVVASGAAMPITWSSQFMNIINIEFSSDNGSTWNTVADSIPASAGSYTWTIPFIVTTEGRIRISNSVNGSPADSSALPFSILSNPDVAGGWNLLSLPLQVTDPLKSDLFPTAISQAFRYDHGYIVTDSLQNGVGYWLKFSQAGFLTITGDSISVDTVNVRAGWNMIGAITTPILKNSIVQIPSNNVVSQYFNYFGGYKISDTLKPKSGYWVKVNSDGKLVLSSGPPLSKIQVTEDRSLASCNSITINDNAGNCEALYIATSDLGFDGSAYTLPPVPPPGGFDVRFSSQCMMEIFDGQKNPTQDFPFSVQSTSFPIRLSWNTVDHNLSLTLRRGNQILATLSGEGTIMLDSAANGLSLHIEQRNQESLPKEFLLEQNYPNPFNPSTIIRYELPKSEHVVLKVYDITGREIATLVNTTQGAGYKEISWNASDLATGIYFYRITAGTFTNVKKMMLVK